MTTHKGFSEEERLHIHYLSQLDHERAQLMWALDVQERFKSADVQERAEAVAKEAKARMEHIENCIRQVEANGALRHALRRTYEARFGSLPPTLDEAIDTTPFEQLTVWLPQLATASRAEDVLAFVVSISGGQADREA